MKRILTLALAICLLFTSCITITEELFLEKNGSGTYVTTVDMKKMQEMMEMVKQFAPGDSVTQMGSAMMKPFGDSLQQMLGELSSIKGITDVKNERVDSGTFRISFRFANITALNQAMRKKQKDQGKDAYSFSKKDFSFYSSSIAENMGSMSELGGLMDEMSGKDTTLNMNGENINLKEAMGMLKMMDMGAKYRTVYHFPSEVVEFSNKDAKLSEDKKTLTLELDLLEAPKGFNLGNNVKLR
jgi:hypothetical protein